MVSIQGVNERETHPAFQATADTLYPLPSIYVFHTPAGWHALNVCDDEPEKTWNIRLTIKIHYKSSQNTTLLQGVKMEKQTVNLNLWSYEHTHTHTHTQ
jgi:hypothetical protein